ncbi:hypothetical protein EB72_03900, partial [Mycobacterium sp. SWH-M1]
MPATISDEQSAARELVRDWAAGSTSLEAVRDVEQGAPDAWRAPFDALAALGIFGVALPEELGGADGTVADLCAMLEEAAAGLIPGPVATTALATLVLDGAQGELVEALASGQRTAGVAPRAELTLTGERVSGTAATVLGATSDGVLLLPAGDTWVLVDATADGVAVERRKATDFSRPLARVTVDGVPATTLDVPAQ